MSIYIASCCVLSNNVQSVICCGFDWQVSDNDRSCFLSILQDLTLLVSNNAPHR